MIIVFTMCYMIVGYGYVTVVTPAPFTSLDGKYSAY